MLPSAAAPIILMVSGGADSVAMTHLLLEAYPDYDYTILHINHGLRGRAADDDGAFVRDLASKLNISFECRHYDLRAIQAVQIKVIQRVWQFFQSFRR